MKNLSEIPAPPSANSQIARAASLVTAAYVLSNVAGLIRQILVANAFGTSAPMEAFNAANRISETLFNLVAGGALGSAFIPTFTSLLAKEKRQEAWKLASSILNIILIILTALAALAAIFAPQLVRYVIAPGFASDPAKEALTIALTRLMLPSAVLFGLSGLVMGILNSHQKFFIPALTPAMYQLGMILGVTVLAPSMGIYGLAWGVLIGSALHLILQLPLLFKEKAAYTPSLSLDTPEVREVARLMGPRVLGVAVVQLNFWINVRLASGMPEGSVTAVQVAFTLMLMPLAAIAQSIATAALPTFSTQVANNKLGEMKNSLSATLRGILLLSIPASLGLVTLRVPIVALVLQRGQFDAHSTSLVAWALLFYGVGLVGHAMVEILARAFYALHDTKTPVMIGIVAMSLNVLFSYIFSAMFIRQGWMPHGGLALANTLATGLEMVGLILIMRKRLGGLNGKQIGSGLGKSLVSGGLMAAAILSWITLAGDFSVWLLALGGILIGIVVYSVGLWVFKTSELKQLYQIIRSRLS
ncbi:MAG: murein biosynthesis integral membrane protein MurJ [Bacteroidetes bacterium]|nr:MAG: murein biosynthesis integral membrane protein MurJ [Bacteroidota bacterium]